MVASVWLTDELKDVSAKVDTPTSLWCEGEGYSYCTWCKSSTGDKKGELSYFTQTKVPVLHFPNLSSNDGGYYTCNLCNTRSQDHVTTKTAHLKTYIKGSIWFLSQTSIPVFTWSGHHFTWAVGVALRSLLIKL